MKLTRGGATAMARGFIAAIAFLVSVGLAFANPVVLDGATFAYQSPVPLQARIGIRAVPTIAIMRGVGGVAMVREASGLNGWMLRSIDYQPTQPDGERFAFVFEHKGAGQVQVRPALWDWEAIPLARFVASGYDSAFTFFGEFAPGQKPTLPRARVVSYHPDLKDTLLGLRLMQLDLMLFMPAFRGHFTNSNGKVILGGGERQAFGEKNSLTEKTTLKRLRDENDKRAEAAMAFLEKDCERNRTRTCIEAGQPFSSYIVGDLISPTTFEVREGKLVFQGRGVCWRLTRPPDPGEAEEIVTLSALSESFCAAVAKEFVGIHPVVYRSALRAMHYAALMRHYKGRDTEGYRRFVNSLTAVKPLPLVSTPTEIALQSTLSPDQLERLRRELEALTQPRR